MDSEIYHFHLISEVFRSFSVLEPRALEEWPRSPQEPCLQIATRKRTIGKWEMGCRRKLPQTKKAGFYHVNKNQSVRDTQPINASYLVIHAVSTGPPGMMAVGDKKLL
jgi:hypothetical protein